MHAYYASATVRASPWPGREPVLKERGTVPEEWQTKLYSDFRMHICSPAHMWVYLETDTNFTNICSFPFLKIMDIAKPLGFIPFSPFLVIPWYLQIVNIPIY